VRILNHSPLASSNKHIGMTPVYRGDEFLTALKRIWFASNQICSKKLVSAIKLWLPFYGKTFEPLTPGTRKLLLHISAASIERVLKPVRVKLHKGRCMTRPGTHCRRILLAA